MLQSTENKESDRKLMNGVLVISFQSYDRCRNQTDEEKDCNTQRGYYFWLWTGS